MSNLKLFLFTALFLLVISCNVNTQTNINKPNFVIIFIDDLGETNIGVYGNDFIETPNIDNLASEGMRWTNAYSAAPICSPSRAAFLTGKHPARVHFTGHITAIGSHRHPENSMIVPPNDLMFIPKDEIILPEAIKPAGYKSISIGKWHVGPKGYWPNDMGFDENVAGWT
ncbi:MAG: sulfatase-like hydrolase/transferase, partial [Candidatus Paceibacterota bacterium]